jgi:hypothetical protein
MLGRTVLRAALPAQSGNESLSVAMLPAGVYIYKVLSGGASVVDMGKLLKQ